MAKEPLVEQLQKQKSSLDDHYSEMKKRFKVARDLYENEYTILKPGAKSKGAREILTIRPRRTVDTIDGHFQMDDIAVEVRPLKDTEAMRKVANQMEEAVKDMFEKTGVKSAISPYSEASKIRWMCGVGVLRGVYNPNIWGDRPTKMDGETQEEFEYQESLWETSRYDKIPFVVTSPDPYNCVWWPLDQPEMFWHSAEVFPIDLMMDMPEYKVSDDDLFKKKKYFEHWSSEIKVFAVDKEPIHTNFLNPFGFCPYTLLWSGLGLKDPEGKPERKAVGLLNPIEGLLQEESRRITAISIILQTHALGGGFTRNLDDTVTLTQSPGDWVEIGNAIIEPYKPPMISQDLYNMYTIIGQEVEEWVSSRVLGGQKIPGIGSALGYELLREEAKKKYKSADDSYEAALSRIGGQYLNVLENHIGEQIPGLALRPSDIRGYYSCKVSIIRKDIAKERMVGALARLFLNSGLYDFDTLHGPNFLNSQNPEKIREGLLKDQILRDPELLRDVIEELKPRLTAKHIVDQAQKRAAEARAINLSQTTAPEVEDRAEEDKFSEMLFGGGVLPEVSGIEDSLAGGFP